MTNRTRDEEIKPRWNKWAILFTMAVIYDDQGVERKKSSFQPWVTLWLELGKTESLPGYEFCFEQ